MKHHMILVLILYILCSIDPVFGMDSYSDKSEPSNEETSIDLAEYTKQELDMDTYNQKSVSSDNEADKNFGTKKLSKESGKKFNELKRKHKLDKTFTCEFCKREDSRYRIGKFSGQSLCNACYAYESRHGQLVPRHERRKSLNQNILACDFCHKESNKYIKGKFSAKYLCKTCYIYESRTGQLVHPDERNHKYHMNHILVCEFCQQESIRYKTGKVSGKSLCLTCYNYESRNGHLVPLDDRKKINMKHKDKILACEFCQKESAQYITGKTSDKILCRACYLYESRNGQLVLRNERKCSEKSLDHIFTCEFCSRESIKNITGKISGKRLCTACYNYESRHGKLVPLDKRNNNVKHKNHILVCEFCQQESTRYKTGKVSGLSVCISCYDYEYYHGDLVARDERKKKSTKESQKRFIELFN